MVYPGEGWASSGLFIQDKLRMNRHSSGLTFIYVEGRAPRRGVVGSKFESIEKIAAV